MIQTELQQEQQGGHIVLCPNDSSHWQQSVYLLMLVSGIAIGIALAFALAGAWLILPFAGLEVILLFALVYRVAQRCRRMEVIQILANHIVIEKGRQQPSERWECDRFSVRLTIKPPPYPWHDCKVYLRCRNEQIELGEFLIESEKKLLIDALKRYVITV